MVTLEERNMLLGNLEQYQEKRMKTSGTLVASIHYSTTGACSLCGLSTRNVKTGNIGEVDCSECLRIDKEIEEDVARLKMASGRGEQ